ncbi:cytosolic carboxypeptidase 2-like [Oscarella lobularis]|uniref:cytosolic carboxypeptidase 2-like n=1 Tax=Oscarella lobularis TaxID=121494 RepID=UPI00331351DE
METRTEELDWINAYRLTGMLASPPKRDPLGLGSLEDWEQRGESSAATEATAGAEIDPELQEARQRLEERHTAQSKSETFEVDLKRTTQLIFTGSRKIPILREPRNLYRTTRDSYTQDVPRWPACAPSVIDRVLHIRYVPSQREPLNKPEPDVHVPKHKPGSGRLVYSYPSIPDRYFTKARIGKSLQSDGVHPTLNGSDDNVLLFESRFESGNLQKAIQIGPYSYQLWLRCDLFTVKHTQWYYFRVQNTKAGVTYRFTIMNLLKSDSLYNHGMKLLMYSEREAVRRRIGWHRVGHHIKYCKNNLRREDCKSEQYCYSLTWQCEFPHSDDTCYFAHSYPYAYSDMQDYLKALAKDSLRSQFCKQRILCRSVAGNLVHLLTITSPSSSLIEAEAKQAVVVTARVHPGETNGSWMMKGFLDFVTGNSTDAKILRDSFVFKVVPMLNPDGVIVGNYRCSLSGRDLNRNYRTTMKSAFPTVWHTKQMIRRLIQEREVVLYCDLHGHSRKQHVFIYGCENRFDPSARLHERVFPMMLHKNAPDKFLFSDCRFKVQKSKEGTGRIVMWREMGIMNSFTMEATFCGAKSGHAGYHFSVADFELMGHHLCDTLLDYCDPDRTKYQVVYQEVEQMVKDQILAKLASMGKELPPGTDPLDIPLMDSDFSSGVESSDGGSDSSVSDGLPMELMYGPAAIRKKKKKKSKGDKKRHPAKLRMHQSQTSLSDEQKSNEPSTVPLTERDIVALAKAGQEKSVSDKDGAPLKMTTSSMKPEPIQMSDFIRSLPDNVSRSSAKRGCTTPNIAGLVEDKESGTVMISGFNLMNSVGANPSVATTALSAATKTSPAQSRRSSIGPPQFRTSSQGPGAFTARYVSHHLAAESGNRLLTAALSGRPETPALHSRSSLIRSSFRLRKADDSKVIPARLELDIVKRRDPIEKDSTQPALSGDSVESIASERSFVSLDGTGLEFLTNRLSTTHLTTQRKKDDPPEITSSADTNSLQTNGSRSAVFMKQLKALQSTRRLDVMPEGGGGGGKREAESRHRKSTTSNEIRSAFESLHEITAAAIADTEPLSTSAEEPRLSSHRLSRTGSWFRSKDRIEEHKSAIAAAVKEHEVVHRQTAPSKSSPPNKLSDDRRTVSTTANVSSDHVSASKKARSPVPRIFSESIAPSSRRPVPRSASFPIASQGTRSALQSAAAGGRRRRDVLNAVASAKRPLTVHSTAKRGGTSYEVETNSPPFPPTVAFLRGDETVEIPGNMYARLRLNRGETSTGVESIADPNVCKVGRRPNLETGTSPATISLTIDEMELLRQAKKKKKIHQTSRGFRFLQSSKKARERLN